MNETKLTQSIFDDAECPAWAWTAAVNPDGTAWVSDRHTSEYHATPIGWRGGSSNEKVYAFKGRIFNAEDWKNSRIEKMDKLPGWCKEFAWIYDTKEKAFGFIKSISPSNFINWEYYPHIETSESSSTTGGGRSAHQFISENVIVPAKFIYWTVRECHAAVGKVFQWDEASNPIETITALCVRCERNELIFFDRCDSEDDVAHMVSYTPETLAQYRVTCEGKACGTFEVQE